LAYPCCLYARARHSANAYPVAAVGERKKLFGNHSRGKFHENGNPVQQLRWEFRQFVGKGDRVRSELAAIFTSASRAKTTRRIFGAGWPPQADRDGRRRSPSKDGRARRQGARNRTSG
jgi:hypothetical protein